MIVSINLHLPYKSEKLETRTRDNKLAASCIDCGYNLPYLPPWHGTLLKIRCVSIVQIGSIYMSVALLANLLGVPVTFIECHAVASAAV